MQGNEGRNTNKSEDIKKKEFNEEQAKWKIQAFSSVKHWVEKTKSESKFPRLFTKKSLQDTKGFKKAMLESEEEKLRPLFWRVTSPFSSSAYIATSYS